MTVGPPEGRTLTWRELNRAVLARQHLLERSDAAMNQVIEDIGGIQAQYAPAPYIALWSRMCDFERAALTDAREARYVVTATLMRVTIHSVSARDYWPIVAGIRRSRQEWLTRVVRSQYGDQDFERAADALREVMQQGPLRQREVQRQMAARGFPGRTVGWASLWVDTIRIPPSATWEHRANDLYDLAERWLPHEKSDPPPSEADGVRLLLTRYLNGFGPARLNDFANWAGIMLALAKEAASQLGLRRFKDEQGRELVDVPDAPLPSAETAAPVRFLPVWDATLLVHCRRALVLPEEFRPRVFNTRTPHSVNTFLVDGQVAGTWRYESGRVTTASFRPLSKSEQAEVDQEAERVAEFHRG